MSKRTLKTALAEIEGLKTLVVRILDLHERHLDEQREIKKQLDRIEAKVDTYFKWNKYGGQLWERN